MSVSTLVFQIATALVPLVVACILVMLILRIIIGVLPK